MATRIDLTQAYPVDPATVRRMLTDLDYVQLRAERTGAISVKVELEHEAGGAVRLDVERVLPADVPSFAKSFIGDALTITERQTWHATAADGSTEATVTATFSAPLSFAGRMTVAADGTGTVVRTTGELKANVPLVGGKVEAIAKDTMEQYLRAEQRIAQEWLADHA